MPADGAMLHTTFERRAIIEKNGDIDDFFSLTLKNVGGASYSFTEHGSWVHFRVTDSPADYVTSHDSGGNQGWLSDRSPHVLVVGTQPSGALAPGGARSFGAHLRRRGRVLLGEREMRFADPFLFPTYGHPEHDVYRVVVIFPERIEGWDLSCLPSDAEVTSRTVTWTLAYNPDGIKQLGATALMSQPGTSGAVQLYDDILAELHILIARDACAIRFDDAALQRKLRDAPDSFSAIKAQLHGISTLGRSDCRVRLRETLDTMSAERVSFARNVAASAFHPRQSYIQPGQQLTQSTAGRDIIQHQHLHFHNTDQGSSMAKTTKQEPAAQPPTPPESAGQTMEDVSAGKDISQQTGAANDKQVIRRAGAKGTIEQKKSGAAQMSLFGLGRATGPGIVGLVLVLIAYFAYRYWAGQ